MTSMYLHEVTQQGLDGMHTRNMELADKVMRALEYQAGILSILLAKC